MNVILLCLHIIATLTCLTAICLTKRCRFEPKDVTLFTIFMAINFCLATYQSIILLQD